MLIEFWYQNLDLVYFIDGLAFFSLAGIIIMQLRIIKSTEYLFSRDLWLLAGFGLVHALSSFADMFTWYHSGYFYFRPLNAAILALAFLIIYNFGFQLVNVGRRQTLSRSFFFLGLAAFLLMPSLTDNSLFGWGTSSRYFLGFIGELLSAIGFAAYYHYNREKIDEIEAGRYFYSAAIFFALLSVTEGLIVPRASLFPASVINTKVFLDLVGVPIQVFRALFTIGIAWAVWHITDIFNAESAYNLMRQKRLLWQSETQAKNILDSVPMGIVITTPEGKIVQVNNDLRKMFGYGPDEDFSSLNANFFYNDHNVRKEILQKLNYSGSVKDLEVKFVRKNGSLFWANLTSAIHSSPDGDSEIFSTIEDISDRKPA